MAAPVDLSVVQELIDQLQAVEGVRSVSMDPAELQSSPYVWVQLRGIRQPYLNGSEIRLWLYLVTGDMDGGMRTATALTDLYNAMLTVVSPDGETETIAVTNTDGTLVPALRLPVDLPNTPPDTP